MSALEARHSGDATAIDLFTSLPNSDAVVAIDLTRVMGEAFPQLLSNEPLLRNFVTEIAELKTLTGLDLRAMRQMVVGMKWSNDSVDTKQPDLGLVAIVRSSEAERLTTIMGQAQGKFLEQQHGGKTVYVTRSDQPEPKPGAPSEQSPERFAVAALDTSTIVFGDESYVHSSIDLNAGKGTSANAKLISTVKSKPSALLSAAGLFPPSLLLAGQELGNSEMSQILSSLKQFTASIDLTPKGFHASITVTAGSTEQAKSLSDVIIALQTVTKSVTAAKTSKEKMVHELTSALIISAKGNDVQLEAEVAQATVNTLVRQIASVAFVSRGLAQMAKEDPDAAITNYDKAIMLNPENVVAFINRGKARSDKSNLDGAIADYDKAIELEPNTELAYNNRGFTRTKKGDFDSAIVDLNRAIELDATDPFAYSNRGLAFAKKGNLEKAMPDYNKSLALYPDNYFAYNNRGQARYLLGDLDGAIEDFSRSIRLNPKTVEALNGRGLARLAMGDLDQAIADFDSAILLDSNDANIYCNRGFTRNSKGDRVGAMADFDKAISINPKSASAYNGRGVAHYASEQFDSAVADFDKAIYLDPNDPLQYSNRGRALTEKGEWDKAFADFDKAIAIDPKLSDAYNGRGMARYYREEFKESIADYDKSIAIDPNSAEVYGNRALARFALRMDLEAEQDLKKCFELDESLRPVFESMAKEIKKTRHVKSKRKP